MTNTQFLAELQALKNDLEDDMFFALRERQLDEFYANYDYVSWVSELDELDSLDSIDEGEQWDEGEYEDEIVVFVEEIPFWKKIVAAIF